MKVRSQFSAALRGGFLFLILASTLCAASSGQSSTPPQGKNFDGPAELLRQQVKSSLKDTPAGGKTWMVRSGQSLEQVLTSASCGDTIQLESGATFTGVFTFPDKSCDDNHWIIVRTSADD